MRLFSLVVFVVLVSLCNAAGVPPTQAQWDAAIQKAKDYLTTNAFTNSEKAALATGVGWEGGQCVGNIPSIPRVNFSGFCLEDSPTGVRFALNVTAFPAAVNVAATWNRSLIYERYAAFGSEFKTKGAHIALAPMMNMGRVAAGGRNWEGFGADPYLTGECAYLAVIGIQDQGVVATSKHYLLNEQEHYRTTSSSNADVRTMHEVYLWPFRQAVKAGTGSVMCSYNLVNGFYACENEYILTEVLKKEFGFQGYIMSDWAATMSGLPSILAGLDMTMPGDVTFNSGTTYFGEHLVDDVANGTVTQARLDDMAIRILTPYFLLNQDQGYPTVDFDFRDYTKLNQRNAQADHATVVRKIGAESNILLKNINNTLPFSSTPTPGGANYTFAVIGSDAGPSPGNYGPTACADHGCDEGTLAQGWGSGTVWFPYLIDPNAAIVNKSTANGQTVISSLNDTIEAAQQAAAQADIAIVFANADSGEDYITVEGNEGDRNNLNLFHNGNALIEAVASVNNRTVVVLHVVGPVVMPWADHPNVTAIILAGLPGQESGNSLVDTLWGAVNPSAKLIYTIAKLESDYGASVLYSSPLPYPPINYTEALLIDYRWFDQKNIAPQYEFGFGLSYTTFSYANLQFTTATPTVTGCATHQALEDDVLYSATIEISNTGSVAGAEVAQLYLGFPEGAGEPPKVLRGFDKVWTEVGGKATASFSLTRIDISIWDPVTAGWVVPAGTFQVMVGASSRDIRLTTNFTVAAVPTVTLAVDKTVAEGATLTATLTLSAASTSTVSVPLLATGGTATSSQYSLSSTCATFAPGALTTTVTITTVDDNVYRGDTNFQLSLQLPTNANLASGTPSSIVIQDNDLPQLSVAAASQTISVSEAAGTVNITLQLSKQSAFSTYVNWTTTGHPNINDIVFSSSLVIPPLVSSVDVPVTVVQDTIYEGNETFILTLSSSSNSSIDASANAVSFTVIDDDPVPYVYLVSNNSFFTASAPTVSFDVFVSNPEEGDIGVALQVNYINASEAVVTFTNGFPNVVIPSATNAVTINVSTVFDSIYEGNQVFSISIANITAGIATIGSTNGRSVTFVIEENILIPSVYFPQSSYLALSANVTENVAVSLTNAANKEIIVPYTFSAIYPDGPVAQSGFVTFAALATSAQIPIYINSSWTSPATVLLDTPIAGPVQLGSVSRFTIYNNFTVVPTSPPTAPPKGTTSGNTTTGPAPGTSTTTGAPHHNSAGMVVPALWLALLVLYNLL
uniref:beta-glucosidase n=1 Tax=Physarum polycephalum TaxID=5791 RepID=Q3V6T3_PHYPO|nr:membrane beta-glucosidase 1 [Physarum polycephalum]